MYLIHRDLRARPHQSFCENHFRECHDDDDCECEYRAIYLDESEQNSDDECELAGLSL